MLEKGASKIWTEAWFFFESPCPVTRPFYINSVFPGIVKFFFCLIVMDWAVDPAPFDWPDPYKKLFLDAMLTLETLLGEASCWFVLELIINLFSRFI